ncbi:MAG: outer membrane beta-barrel protein [Proteobacteria bacterium]|nr:outer membrane beta-barrel protein [Pseudomonadota bacterium]
MWFCPATAQAVADSSDIFKPYVTDTVTYDDNLFRRSSDVNAVMPSGFVQDDVMNQATAGSAINYTLGRQKFNLSLSVSDNRFVNNQFLDNVSTNNRAVWQWQLGRQWSGDVGYAYTRAMGGFTNTNFFGLDMITGNNPFANLNYTWHPRWKVRTGLNWQDFRHSASQRKSIDWQYATILFGLDYATPSSNTLGLQYSFNEGNYPNRELLERSLIDNRYQQHNINSLLTWAITQKIRFNGNLGYVIRQNPHFSQRDFSGETFNLALNWTPTAKTMLTLSVWRQLTSWPDVTSTYVITDGFSVSPMWQASPKVALSAKFTRQTLDYTGDTGLVSALPTRQDTLTSGQISLVYAPVPNAEITLGYQGGTRATNYTLLDYTFNSVFSSLMLKF